uniref:Uncharacterized protein n=1 Tax=Oryza rufipogon TaxID=4529 RepID=A0A0E0Q7V8_ORYRU
MHAVHSPIHVAKCRSEATCSHACVLARGRLLVSFAPPPRFPPVGRGARSRFQRHEQGRDVDSGGAEETASSEASAASLAARRPVHGSRCNRRRWRSSTRRAI